MMEQYAICSICYSAAIRKGQGSLAFCEKHNEEDLSLFKRKAEEERYKQFCNGFEFHQAFKE
jgi:hypothetical protein